MFVKNLQYIFLLAAVVCLQSSSADCVVERPDFLGDGYCDNGAYNTPACDWDHGDCCAETCVDAVYECGYTAFNCTNPGVNSAAPTPIPPTRSPTRQGCDVQNADLIGDGFCDRTGGYNTEACLWDGGDCCESTCVDGLPNECGVNGYSCHLDTPAPSVNPTLSPTTACKAPDLSLVGDGFCDPGPEYNNALCDWDGGDCCHQTCTSTPNPCGANGYVCKQPEYSNAPTFVPTAQPSTAAPTPAPSTALPTTADHTDEPTNSAATTQMPTSKPSTAAPSLRCFDNCPAPALKSVRFSDDGTHILIVFDRETDKASFVTTSASIPCNLLTQFNGDSMSICSWSSSTTLVARLGRNALSAGELVAVLSGTVRVKCTSFINCESRLFAPLLTSTIEAPSNPAKPVVLLRSLSTVLNECDSILLDASQSSGSGASAWAEVSWEVSGPGVVDEATILAQLNAYGSALFSTLTVSSGYTLGLVSFKVILTNFVGGRDESSVDVFISDLIIPAVSVLGAKERQFYINEPVALRAFSFIPSCLKDRVFSSTFTWSVSDSDGTHVAVTSTSNTPSRFIAPPFSFKNGTYTVAVTSIPDNGVPGTFEVAVQVRSQGAVASIAGGSFQSRSSLSNFSIDASSSNHPSYPNSARLFYSWSCALAGEDCGLSTALPPTAVITLIKGEIAASTEEYIFTVTVTSDKDDLSSSASVRLRVFDFALPSTAIGVISKKYNPQAAVTVEAILGPLQSDSPVDAVWTVSPPVESGAMSSELELHLDGLVPSYKNFPISFSPNKLSAGVTYTLSLIASFTGSDVTGSSSSVDIRMNIPPYNGALVVTPASGISLSTIFVLANQDWIVEVDSLPVVYFMSAATGGGNADVDLGRTEASFINSALPPGLQGNNNLVTCSAVVRDLYGSRSVVVSDVVTVFPSGEPSVVADALNSIITSAEATQDFDLLLQAIGIGASNLNLADCRSAPDCNALNRYPCSTTPGTCGECLLNYFGIDGASNEACESVGSRRLLDGSACTVETTTSFTTSCHKKCPNDCSGNGSCKARGFIGDELEYCAVGDFNCYVSCECVAGSFGRSCDLTEPQYVSALETRNSICFSFYKSLVFQDASSEVVSSRLVLTSLILLDSTQISEDALTNCTRVVTDTVFSYPDLVALDEVLPLVVDALSRALNSKDIMSADLLNSTYRSIDALMLKSQQLSSPESSGIEVITQNIRLTSSVLTANGINEGGTIFSVPRTIFEVGFNTPAAYVVLTDNNLIDTDPTTFGLSIVQYTNNPSKTVSNSSLVNVQASYDITNPSDGTRSLNFTVVLQNTVPFDYAVDNGTELAFRCDETADSAPYTISVNCSGVKYEAICPGNVTAELLYICPHVNEFPKCNSYELDGSLSELTTCTLISYTDTSTTCFCSLSMDTLTIGTKASAANIGSGFFIVVDSFLFTWNRINVLTAADILQNAIMFGFMLGLICALVIGLLFFGYRDIENVAQKHRRQRQVALSVDAFFRKVIPKQFEESSWPVRFLKVMSERHSWICFLFPLAEDDYRTCQWNILIGKLINYVFVGTLLTVFFFGDDGTCERQNNKSDCLALKSVDFETSVCGWNEEHDFCEYVEPSETFLTLIILAIAINVLAVPLDVIVYWATSHYKALLTYYSEARIAELREKEKIAFAADPEANRKGTVVSVMHELKSYPSKKATFIRAARLVKMQQQIDNVEVNAEVAIMMSLQEAALPSSDANAAVNLLSDYVTPTKRDFKSVVTRKAAVSRHLIRQNITGKNAFDGRSAILKKHKNGVTSTQQFSQANLETRESDKNLQESMNGLDEGSESEVDLTGGGGGGVMSKLEDFSYQQLLRRNVKLARARASKIKRRIGLLATDERKEIYLVRKFLVDNMIGIRRKVANRFFFGKFNDEFAYARKNIKVLQLVCLLFPLYLAVICLYVFLYGVTLGSRSTNLWMIGMGIAYLQDIFLLETCNIYMVNVALVSVVYKDLKLLSNRLRKRSKAILNRVEGQMSLAKCYLQHLNAACRAARKMPELGVSRLLMSLNDFDMPKAFVPRYHQPQSKWYLLFTSLSLAKNFFVLIYVSLPDFFQDAIVETFVCCGLNFLFILVYLGAVVSGDDADIAGVFVFFIIMAVLLLPWTKAIRARLWNLVFPPSDGEVKYDAEDDEFDSDGDEFENEVFNDLDESDSNYMDEEEDEEYDFNLEISDDSSRDDFDT